MDRTPPKILIADDSKANLVALRRLLAKIDATVIAAASGNEALAAALDHDFALALLDVNMPDISGYEVAAMLHDEERTRTVPIIFVTAAYRDERHRQLGYAAGAVNYIEKPIDEQVLLSKVRVFLEIYRIREELRHQSRRQELILESLADGIFGTDETGIITFANPAMMRMSGRLYNWLVGQPASQLLETPDALAPGHAAPDDEETPIARVCRTGRTEIVSDQLLRRPDGSFLPVDYTAAALKLGEGTNGSVVVVRDATDRRLYELALETARRAAEDANRAKSSFLAIMSHELRTPLNTILGFAEIIRDCANGMLGPERHAEYAADICSAGNHLLDLINDILDLSKIESGRMEIDPTWLGARHLIAATLRLVQEKATRKRIGIDTELTDTELRLWADERAAKQILVNLLANAIKFTPEGGRIVVRAAADDHGIGGVELSVADTGLGIPADKLHTLFEPFHQIDNRYNRSVNGTGLGLSLSRGLAELHVGSITIASSPEQGTRVTVRLPPGPA